MTLDPDRRRAIRALVVQNADPAQPKGAGGVVRQRLAFVSLGVAIVVLIGTVVALVGIALPVSPVAGPLPGATATASSDPDDSIAADPAPAVGLVGLWSLTDAPGEPSAAVRIDGSMIMVYRDCGVLFWDFAAAGGLLATVGPGGSDRCFRGDDGFALPPETAWAGSLRGYRAVSGGWELLDRGGAVVGRLSAISELPDSITVTDAPTDVPALDEESRERLQNPVPLPSSLVAATHDDILGTWKVVGDTQVAGATITFRDGDYVVRDCHSAGLTDSSAAVGQAWVGDGHLFVAAAGAVSAMACTPSFGVPPSQIRTIAVVEGDLVLFDAQGAELGRLERADGEPSTS